jgi:hypothetical protein
MDISNSPNPEGFSSGTESPNGSELSYRQTVCCAAFAINLGVFRCSVCMTAAL